MGLPLDSLTIKPANAKQTRISREATFNEWNRGLTLEQYINREVRLEQCDFAADGNLTTWVLVPRENLETDDILCSCETYRRKVAVKEDDETNLKFAIGYGIASVYTREHLRSNGYAGHMMKLLHWVLGAKDSLPPFPQGWGNPPLVPAGVGNGVVSVLYSDVGGFYGLHGPSPQSKGWRISETWTTIWGTTPESNAKNDVPQSITWMDGAAVTEELRRDEASLLNDFAKGSGKHAQFTFLPSEHQLPFPLRRVILTMDPSPAKWGAKLQNTGEFMIWTYESKPAPSRILISHVRVKRVDSLKKLVAAAMAAAREEGMEQVEVWNMPEEFRFAAEEIGGISFERDEHLPSFFWYGKSTDDPGEIIWRNNEKFAWC